MMYGVMSKNSEGILTRTTTDASGHYQLFANAGVMANGAKAALVSAPETVRRAIANLRQSSEPE